MKREDLELKKLKVAMKYEPGGFDAEWTVKHDYFLTLELLVWPGDSDLMATKGDKVWSIGKIEWVTAEQL
jgi:hypothetical protein